ncbi:MAG: hypothetical protein AAF609_14960 [Cyanobacteria bacterium P01_C01_bin.120]
MDAAPAKTYYFNAVSTRRSTFYLCELVKNAERSQESIAIRTKSLSKLLELLIAAGHYLKMCDWPSSYVSFVVEHWDAADEAIEGSAQAYLESNLWRWGRSLCDPSSGDRVDQWEAKDNLFEDFNLINSFQISRVNNA